MRIGSMFSGLLGGLDIACERVFNAETAWQLDITGASVRRRHWPDAVQVEADVRTVDPADLARVDIIVGGFPCQDLSTAGKQAGLDGARSGLYRHMLRFADAMQPQFIVFENVAPLLGVLDVLAADLRSVGYGLTYAVCEAADAGLPHLRRRVFVVAERGVAGRGRVEVDTSRRWSPVESGREWATPLRADAEMVKSHGGHGEALNWQVREWATANARDHRCAGGLAHTKGGACLNDQAAQVREWPSPTAVGGQGEAEKYEARQAGRQHWSGPNLPTAVVIGQGDPREWATVTTRDHKSGDLPNRVGTEALSAQAGAALLGQHGKRLRPEWVECLMGLPQGWTEPTGPNLRDQLDAWRAPRGRYPATWDRSVPWPGFAWEPPRTLPDGPPAPGRPARIKGLGNGVVWQQAVLGLDACVNGCATGQLALFGAAK